MTPRTQEIGVEENAFYTLYKATFLKANGAVISNYKPVPWCPNGGIGCDNDVTSEAIARLARYAYLTGDKLTFDKVVSFYSNYMKDPNTYHMRWLMNSDGSSKSSVSATDADLIFTEALINAQDKWGGNYDLTANNLLKYFKTGLYNNNIPLCMSPWNTNGVMTLKPCGTFGNDANALRVNLGYLSLQSLSKICEFDSSLCPAYASSKNLMIGSIQNNGVMTRYYLLNNTYAYSDEEGWIHQNWVLKNLGTDSGTDSWNAIKPMYDNSKSRFMADRSICQSFKVGSGCDLKSYEATPISVYAVYLEIAVTHDDKAFANELIKQMQLKIKSGQDYPLAGTDNFANMITLESFGMARANGYTVG